MPQMYNPFTSLFGKVEARKKSRGPYQKKKSGRGWISFNSVKGTHTHVIQEQDEQRFSLKGGGGREVIEKRKSELDRDIEDIKTVHKQCLIILKSCKFSSQESERGKGIQRRGQDKNVDRSSQ